VSRDKAHYSRPKKHWLGRINIQKLLTLAGIVCLTILAWLFAPWAEGVILVGWDRSVFVLAIIIFQAIYTLALLEYGLSTEATPHWSYRLAFFLSTGLILTRWVFLPPTSTVSGPIVLGGVLGAFLGAIIGTIRREGLLEDNYPPPDHIRKRVHQIHLDTIGIPPPPPLTKRLFDIALGVVGIVLSMPIWIVCVVILWLEDPGPLFFVKNSVGKGGQNFHQFKFRTMVRDAEITTGPVLAREDDLRALWFGRFLRKSALDELPQLLNILRGEMSFVGPRPQRTILVAEYLEEMPEFAERHRVLPGLSGLAQVAGDYYLKPRQKLRFDRLYTRYASLGFDLKLILLAFVVVFWLRWKSDWDGRLPRSWLRWGAHQS